MVCAVSSMCSILRQIKAATNEDRKVMTEVQNRELKELETFFAKDDFELSLCVDADKKAEEIWGTVQHGKKRSAPQ